MSATLLALALLGPVPPQALSDGWKTAKVSWYESGHTTANGERFDPEALTCAHRTLPFNTRVEFRLRGRSVTCRINDRGPFVKGREFDFARGAARKLGMLREGVAAVQWREVAK